jgi:clan AA aspartic protease
MGVTELEVEIANPKNPKKKEKVKFLVDSGAIYSVVPETILKRIGIKPHSKEDYILADGTKIERDRGDALFFYDGKQGASPVVFGKRGDGVLLGAVTLESLGFILDPIRRRLRDLPMLLA